MSINVEKYVSRDVVDGVPPSTSIFDGPAREYAEQAEKSAERAKSEADRSEEARKGSEFAAARSQVAAGVSEAYSVVAQNAAESANAKSGQFVTIAAGLLASTDGQSFLVQGDGANIAYYTYRRVNSTTATLLSASPSKRYIDALARRIGGIKRWAPLANPGDKESFVRIDKAGNIVGSFPDEFLLARILEIENVIEDLGPTPERLRFAPLLNPGDGPSRAVIDAAGNLVGGELAFRYVAQQLNPYRYAPFAYPTQLYGKTTIDAAGSLYSGFEVSLYLEALAEGGTAPIPPSPEGGGLSFEAAQEIPSISAGSLFTLGATGQRLIADPAPFAFQAGPMISGPAILTSLNRASVAATTPVAVGEVGDGWFTWVMPSGRTVCFIIPVLGQSNAVGARGVPLLAPGLTNKWPTKILMPGGDGMDVRFGLSATGTVPVLDVARITGLGEMLSKANSDARGVTSSEGFAHALATQAEQSLGFVPRVLAFNPGWGSSGLTALSKGGQIYTNMMAGLNRLIALVRARGWVPYIPFCTWYHGEAEAGSSTYGAALQVYRNTVVADFIAATGQADTRIPFMMRQLSNFYEDKYLSAQAMYELARDRPEEFGITGPGYGSPFASDFLHYSAVGHWDNGEGDFYATARSFFSTGRIQPGLMPVANGITYVGNEVVIPMPYPVLRDQVNMTDPGAAGFRLFDGAGIEVAITGVVVASDGLSVRLTPAAALSSGAGRAVSYAFNSKYVQLVGRKSIADAPRGQIRAVRPLTVSQATGLPIYDWLVGFLERF